MNLIGIASPVKVSDVIDVLNLPSNAAASPEGLAADDPTGVAGNGHRRSGSIFTAAATRAYLCNLRSWITGEVAVWQSWSRRSRPGCLTCSDATRGSRCLDHPPLRRPIVP